MRQPPQADQRDFNTDSRDRYPRDFLKPLEEGRTYEDLQTPTKLRLRELVRRSDSQERYLPTVEKLFVNKISVTFTSAGVDVEIPHDLGVVPSEVIAAVPSADARIYRGSTPWTRDNIYLRASAACTTTLYPVV